MHVLPPELDPEPEPDPVPLVGADGDPVAPPAGALDVVETMRLPPAEEAAAACQLDPSRSA